MLKKTVIILTHPDKESECYSNLKKACFEYDWKYNTLVKKKLPISKDGWKIERVVYR